MTGKERCKGTGVIPMPANLPKPPSIHSEVGRKKKVKLEEEKKKRGRKRKPSLSRCLI
jgi:hypothetical protein